MRSDDRVWFYKHRVAVFAESVVLLLTEASCGDSESGSCEESVCGGVQKREEKTQWQQSAAQDLAAEKSNFSSPLLTCWFRTVPATDSHQLRKDPGADSLTFTIASRRLRLLCRKVLRTRKSVGDFVCGIFPPLPELRCCDIWLFKGLDSADEGKRNDDDGEDG